MASDGKVVISTALDNGGIRKGVKEIKGELGGLNSVLKTLGATIATVFSIRQIVSFMADSSKAARDLSDALTGLKSILDGQGRSFSDAEKFLQEYTADGLIPMTNAITAYKNLASRGYDDSQIRSVMQALKDASAYGRQASYTMGEAVQSATEGLKNENSILVDNAGVTKNVAKMWEEYAASIGTTANNLTQAQKIQAEVNGILEETKYQTGDAATVAGTLSGQLQQLSYNFNNLKVAVGNIINPIAESFLPIINTAIVEVTKLANALATVVGLVFGKVSSTAGNLAESNDSIADSAHAGAEAEQELADATTAAGKAAKKSLASFDELNRLQDASGGNSSGASGGGISAGSNTIEANTEVEDTISPKFQAIADKIQKMLEPLREIDFGPAVDAFDRLGDAAQRLGETIGEALEWVWFNILVPLAEWTAEEALPAFLDLLSAALELLNSVIVALRPAVEWLWDNFLQPIAEWTGDTIIATLKELTDLFRDLSKLLSGEMSFKEFLAGLTDVQTLLLAIAAAIVAIKIAFAGLTVFKTITAFFKSVKDLKATSLIGKIAKVFMLTATGTNTLSEAMSRVFGPGSIIAGIGSVIGGAVLAVTNFFSMLEGGFTWAKEALMLLGIAITTVGAIILGAPAGVATAIGAIVATVTTAVVLIKQNWATISDWFDKNVIQPISDFFSDLWEDVSSWASETWEDIKEFFSPAIEWFEELLGSIEQTFDDIFYNIGVIASGCWEIIKAVWEIVSGWFDENIIQPVAKFFSGLWENISQWASNAWENIKGVFSRIGTWIDTNVIQPVSEFFSGLWENFSEWASDAWEDVKDIFSGMGEWFKGILNGIIRLFNKAIDWIFTGINKILLSMKDTEMLGMKPFSGIRAISVPQIPYLAQGAVLPANKPFLAMVGDQKHGTNIEAPLSTIQEAVAIVMEDMVGSQVAGFEAVVSVLREILEAILGIEIDGETLAKAVENYQRKMAVVRGG